MAGGEGRLRRVEDKHEGYTAYDNAGEKVGKVGAVFVEEDDREEYLGVKTGLLGTRSALVPMGIVRINERERAMEVAESKDLVKNAPAFDDGEDVTREHEDRVRRHFGVESLEDSGGRAKRPEAATGGSDEESGMSREGEVRRKVRRRVRTEEVEDIEEESIEGEPERQDP